MSRWLAFSVLALCAAGCQTPQPLLSPGNPFGGYGNPCVPPPPTGSIGYGQGYYQAPVGSLYGPTARALQPVPSLGSAPSQLRTSQAPSNESGASYQPPQMPSNGFASRGSVESDLPVNSPNGLQPRRGPISTTQDGSLVWNDPYVNRSMATPTQFQSMPRSAMPQQQPAYTYQPPSTTSTLGPYGSLEPNFPPPTTITAGPPIGQIPGPPAPMRYSSPVIPSFARTAPGFPNSDLAYASPEVLAPAGSVVTYESPYGQPSASHVPYLNIPPAQNYGNGYHVADDGWSSRSKSLR